MARDRLTSASDHLLAFPGLKVSPTPLPFLFLFEERSLSFKLSARPLGWIFTRASKCWNRYLPRSYFSKLHLSKTIMVAKRHQDEPVTHHAMRHNVPHCLRYFSQRLVHPLLPYGIMGINALFAGLLCMTLPETKGTPTAETVDSEEGAEEAYVALQVGILLRSTK